MHTPVRRRLTKDLGSARHQLEETRQHAESLKQELAAAEEQLLARYTFDLPVLVTSIA